MSHQMLQMLNKENLMLRNKIEQMAKEAEQGQFLERLTCHALSGLLTAGVSDQDAAERCVKIAGHVLDKIVADGIAQIQAEEAERKANGETEGAEGQEAQTLEGEAIEDDEPSPLVDSGGKALKSDKKDKKNKHKKNQQAQSASPLVAEE